ncbi:MAG: NAD(P)/FAD-dependent oxidoreductase [Proteobacteria bacterium]|nr:NAD(P)/FAD-dependent oxidoreductase [Pseudomonadota bacterium]
MTYDYDIVVVGAGPAGLMTAKTASEEGLKVLLFDAKEDLVKVKRSCCANLINEPNIIVSLSPLKAIRSGSI